MHRQMNLLSRQSSPRKPRWRLFHVTPRRPARLRQLPTVSQPRLAHRGPSSQLRPPPQSVILCHPGGPPLQAQSLRTLPPPPFHHPPPSRQTSWEVSQPHHQLLDVETTEFPQLPPKIKINWQFQSSLEMPRWRLSHVTLRQKARLCQLQTMSADLNMLSGPQQLTQNPALLFILC